MIPFSLVAQHFKYFYENDKKREKNKNRDDHVEQKQRKENDK